MVYNVAILRKYLRRNCGIKLIETIHFARYENRIFKEVCLFIDHFFCELLVNTV